MNECVTCGYPTVRPEGHAEWCAEVAEWNRRPTNAADALDEATVREAKRSDESAMAVARRLGVSASTIDRVRAGRSWGHVA